MKFSVLILGVIGLHLKECLTDENVIVRVQHGRLRGQKVPSKAGGIYFSFKGVPYARPPIGYLRFLDARQLRPWYGVRDAFVEGPKCTQPVLLTDKFVGQEDCLYLNVYTPKLPDPELKPLPVMVWIHGGGFIFGSGNSGEFGPDYLVSEGIVLVTINYRLGPFGFLYMKEAAPGNVGLKDQVMALRWVQRNILAFGGDPNMVTIFGESAGGASVHLHMLSPMSKGLFHRALAQSGAAMNPWAVQRDPEEKARRLGRALDCGEEEPESLLDCLRDADYMSIIKATHDAVPTHAERERLLDFIFVPTVDYFVPGVETFLLGPPENLTAEGLFHDVPYMTGVTSQEGILIWAFNTKNFFNESELMDLDGKWDLNVWPELRVSPDSLDKESGIEDIRKMYLNDKPLSQDYLQKYFDLFSDIEFGEGIAYTVRHMAKFEKAPVYLYSFDVDDKLNFLKNEFNLTWPGAAHADEIGYIFNVKQLPQVAEDSSAAVTRRRIVRMWTNFAKYGDPTPTEDPLLEVKWKPYSEKEHNYLEITSKLIPETDLYESRFAFWEDFYLNHTPKSLQ